jgi:hypothetical protein
VGEDPPLGAEGGGGYLGAKEDGMGWCLPLRADVEGPLRIAAAEEK